MDFVLNHLSEILFGLAAIACIVLYVMERGERQTLKMQNHVLGNRNYDLGIEANSHQQKYAMACKQIKEQREANRLLTDQLANSCTFNLIKNTEPLTNADPEYYDLNHLNVHYFFTDTEVEHARKRAEKNPEDISCSEKPNN